MEYFRIKCYLCSSMEVFCYRAIIVDSLNNIVLDVKTNNIKNISFIPKLYCIYKLYIIYNNHCYKKVFYIDGRYNELLIPINFSNIIKVFLTDKNYKGLKIEKGELKIYG